MTPEFIVHLLRSALTLAVALSLPVLAAALGTSLLVGLLQALTSMQENTVATVPRLLAAAVAAIAAAPWALNRLSYFTTDLFYRLGEIAR